MLITVAAVVATITAAAANTQQNTVYLLVDGVFINAECRIYVSIGHLSSMHKQYALNVIIE